VAGSWIEEDVLAPIVGGTGSIGNRVGRKIAVTGLQIKGVLFGGAVGTGGFDDYYNTVRLVVLGFRSNKTGAALTPLSTTGLGFNSPLVKMSLPGLAHVFRDQMIGITNMPYGAGNCAPGHRMINIYIRFRKPLVVQYTTAGADTNQYQLYISMISDSAAVPSPGFTQGFYKLTYTDA